MTTHSTIHHKSPHGLARGSSSSFATPSKTTLQEAHKTGLSLFLFLPYSTTIYSFPSPLVSLSLSLCPSDIRDLDANCHQVPFLTGEATDIRHHGSTLLDPALAAACRYLDEWSYSVWTSS
jgi:hypothetical protein